MVEEKNGRFIPNWNQQLEAEFIVCPEDQQLYVQDIFNFTGRCLIFGKSTQTSKEINWG